MRKITIQLLMVMMTILTSTSCSKNNEKIDKEELDEKNLTPCPENLSCQYLFTENADANEAGSLLVAGPYRLFWAEFRNGGFRRVIYVKAPMKGNNFTLNKQAILDGKVQVIHGCPNCLMVAYMPVDGYVKGVNLTPDKRADQTKWLLEAKIVLQAVSGPAQRDTITVKQYFYPNFVFN